MSVPSPHTGGGGCMAMDHVTDWIQEIEKDPRAHDEWHAKYREHFAGGGDLRQIAADLRGTGLMSDHDIDYIESIPSEIHEEVRALVVHYLERDERWRFRWHHQPADEFSVWVHAHPKDRIVWLTLVGPHE
jgi:hypothetical protein